LALPRLSPFLFTMEEIPYISGTLADNEEGIIHKIASAIYNDVVSGLRGYHHNPSMSLQ
jgi:hypothetical protein